MAERPGKAKPGGTLFNSGSVLIQKLKSHSEALRHQGCPQTA
jgi:hypothetical protein